MLARELEKVVTVARHQETVLIMSKLKHGLVGDSLRKGFACQHHIVPEMLEEESQILRNILIEQELHPKA